MKTLTYCQSNSNLMPSLLMYSDDLIVKTVMMKVGIVKLSMGKLTMAHLANRRWWPGHDPTPSGYWTAPFIFSMPDRHEGVPSAVVW